MSIVKSQILNQLANSYPNFLRKDLEKALDLIFNEIIQSIARGNNIEIRGFGSFRIKQLKSRIGRNPKNGLKIEVPSKKTVKWKMSKEFFQELNKKKFNE